MFGENLRFMFFNCILFFLSRFSFQPGRNALPLSFSRISLRFRRFFLGFKVDPKRVRIQKDKELDV